MIYLQLSEGGFQVVYPPVVRRHQSLSGYGWNIIHIQIHIYRHRDIQNV